MVYRQGGKPNKVDDRCFASPNRLLQLGSRPFLMMPRKGKDHSPVSALKIALPGATAFLFQNLLLRLGELAQIRITRDDYPDLCLPPQRRPQDLAYLTPVFTWRGNLLGRIERCVLVKACGRSRCDEAMQRIGRPGLPFMRLPAALFVPSVLPDQFIGVVQGVLAKDERMRPIAGETLAREREKYKKNYYQGRIPAEYHARATT